MRMNSKGLDSSKIVFYAIAKQAKIVMPSLSQLKNTFAWDFEAYPEVFLLVSQQPPKAQGIFLHYRYDCLDRGVLAVPNACEALFAPKVIVYPSFPVLGRQLGRRPSFRLSLPIVRPLAVR